MKRAIIFVLVLVVVMASVGSALAESVTIEDAYQVFEALWAKASEFFVPDGWVFVSQEFSRPEDAKALTPTYYVSKQWYHINSKGFVDQRVNYRDTFEDGEVLSEVAVGKIFFSIAEKLVVRESDWFPLKFDSVYKDRLDYEIENRYGHEIRIENAELEGKKVIFIEMLFYWSPEDRESYKERNGLEILGDYFRTWFDPETGAMVKCDSARMKTDRTLIPGGSTAHGYFMRVKEVPEKVLKDFEMVRSEDFEGWTTYRGAESISIDPSESIEPSGAKEGAFQTFLSPAGTYNGVRFWAEARLNNRTKSYSGVAKSVASQSINSIGGYYFGLREYCNGIMHGNTPYPGWTSSPGSSASASTAIIDWSPNCSDNLPIGSGIGGKFVFNFYNHEEDIIGESPVFWR